MVGFQRACSQSLSLHLQHSQGQGQLARRQEHLLVWRGPPRCCHARARDIRQSWHDRVCPHSDRSLRCADIREDPGGGGRVACVSRIWNLAHDSQNSGHEGRVLLFRSGPFIIPLNGTRDFQKPGNQPCQPIRSNLSFEQVLITKYSEKPGNQPCQTIRSNLTCEQVMMTKYHQNPKSVFVSQPNLVVSVNNSQLCKYKMPKQNKSHSHSLDTNLSHRHHHELFV